MAQQEGGWPLGLRPLNARVGVVRNRGYSGSASLSTLLTGSPSSIPDTSSDLDTESTGSFFHDKSVTLGSLIGASSILELPRRSARIRIAESCRDKRSYKSKSWFFSLCSKLNTDAVTINGAQSLGYFLEAERRATSGYRRNRNLALCRPSYLTQDPPASDSRALCVGGQVATNSAIPTGADGKRNPRKVQVDDLNAYGVPLFFSCLRGQIIG
ncbi:uncharacterized protein LOC115692783 [Syzygium oleosum]|uniref:uncharacterized protein LOC115692783 n=1 Tax=Syzygium oleosum TaxID=219896 RepID=UPI0011D22E85|nr:uncharacterized protein LOC115692783 [Syzygium oleosum]